MLVEKKTQEAWGKYEWSNETEIFIIRFWETAHLPLP